MPISFADRVAIVTGAGGGLGRAYSLELARRGAKVVVNDLGGMRDGSGNSEAALEVAEEIAAAGGQAMASAASVTDYEQMVEMVNAAKQQWGGVHILINNAGILRDKSFARMEPGDFEAVLKVHLIGSALASKACWDTMREQNYGRVLMTSSSSGLFGNFGQANYGAAKLGLVGLAKTLHLEGAKHDIRVNTLAPVAATRMTEDMLPEEAFRLFVPEHVVPAALYLVSDAAPRNVIVGAGAGAFHCAFVTMNQPLLLAPEDRTVEGFAAHWEAIAERGRDIAPQSATAQIEALGAAARAGSH